MHGFRLEQAEEAAEAAAEAVAEVAVEAAAAAIFEEFLTRHAIIN